MFEPLEEERGPHFTLPLKFLACCAVVAGIGFGLCAVEMDRTRVGSIGTVGFYCLVLSTLGILVAVVWLLVVALIHGVRRFTR